MSEAMHKSESLTERERRKFMEEYASLPRSKIGHIVKDFFPLLCRKWGISRGCGRKLVEVMNREKSNGVV